MKFSKKTLGCLLGVACIGLSSQSTVMAGHADQTDKGVTGVVTCGGNFFTRKGGTELNTTNYILRNLADSGSINIDRIRVFNAHGVNLFDSDISGMPVFRNNVLGVADTSLDPHQTAQLNVAEMISLQGQTTRPLQAVFNWSSDKKILTLEASVVRVNLDRDPLTGVSGRQRGRHLYECRTTSLKKHNHRHDHD